MDKELFNFVFPTLDPHVTSCWSPIGRFPSKVFSTIRTVLAPSLSKYVSPQTLKLSSVITFVTLNLNEYILRIPELLECLLHHLH